MSRSQDGSADASTSRQPHPSPLAKTRLQDESDQQDHFSQQDEFISVNDALSDEEPCTYQDKGKKHTIGDVLNEAGLRDVETITPWTADVDWDSPASADQQLSAEIKGFTEYISPTDQEHESRSCVVESIRRLIIKRWPDVQVHALGSFETRLYLPRGDINLVIISPSISDEKDAQKRMLFEIEVLLQWARLGFDLVVISKAHVPVLKFVTVQGRFKVDISLNMMNEIHAGQRVTQLFKEVGEAPARSLVMVIKAFLNQRDMNEVRSGGLGSYSIICLVVSFLQLHPKLQEKEIDPCENLGTLLIEFLELYGKRFNFTDSGICLSGGGSYYSKSSRGWVRADQPYLLSIEDPADTTNDVAKGSYNIRAVQQALGGAYEVLSNAVSVRASTILAGLAAAQSGKKVPVLSGGATPEEPVAGGEEQIDECRKSLLESIVGVTAIAEERMTSARQLAMMETVQRKSTSKKRTFGEMFDEEGIQYIGNTTPWTADVDWASHSSATQQLSAEIKAFTEHISPTEQEHELRCCVIESIRRLIVSHWTDAQVHVFGSFETRLYLPTGDIDLVIISPSRSPPEKRKIYEALCQIAALLRSAGMTKNPVVIGKARVPIVKFVTVQGGFNVDISLNRMNGLHVGERVTQLFREIGELPARSLVMVIKAFLNQRNMNEVRSGGLGSYSTICLVVSFLQLHPKLQKKEIDPCENLGTLLIEFLELYGKHFNFTESGICLSGGGSYYSKSSRGWVRADQPYLLSIEDPADPTNDVAKGSYNIRAVQQALGGAYEVLSNAVSVRASTILAGLAAAQSGNKVPVLSGGATPESVKGGDDQINECRKSLLGCIVGVTVQAEASRTSAWKLPMMNIVQPPLKMKPEDLDDSGQLHRPVKRARKASQRGKAKARAVQTTLMNTAASPVAWLPIPGNNSGELQASNKGNTVEMGAEVVLQLDASAKTSRQPTTPTVKATTYLNLDTHSEPDMAPAPVKPSAMAGADMVVERDLSHSGYVVKKARNRGKATEEFAATNASDQDSQDNSSSDSENVVYCTSAENDAENGEAFQQVKALSKGGEDQIDECQKSLFGSVIGGTAQAEGSKASARQLAIASTFSLPHPSGQAKPRLQDESGQEDHFSQQDDPVSVNGALRNGKLRTYQGKGKTKSKSKSKSKSIGNGNGNGKDKGKKRTTGEVLDEAGLQGLEMITYAVDTINRFYYRLTETVTPDHGRQTLIGTYMPPQISKIKAFTEYISPTDREHEFRSCVVESIRRLIIKRWPDAQVHVFGSFETRLYLPMGDIDLVILFPSMTDTMNAQKRRLTQISELLKLACLGTDLIIIGRARVPIVKFVTVQGGFKVDISLNMMNGIHAGQRVTQLFKEVGEAPARSLIMVIKAFLSQRNMHVVRSGGLGSYSIICLVVSFLQLHPKLQEKEIDPCENLGTLLIEFLELYGKRFNFTDSGICLSGGGSYYSKSSRGWVRAYQPYLLSIEDPADPTNDVAKGSYNIRAVQQALGGAYEVLSNAISVRASTILAGLAATQSGEQVPTSSGGATPEPVKGGDDQIDECRKSLLGCIVGVTAKAEESRARARQMAMPSTVQPSAEMKPVHLDDRSKLHSMRVAKAAKAGRRARNRARALQEAQNAPAAPMASAQVPESISAEAQADSTEAEAQQASHPSKDDKPVAPREAL